MGQYGALYMEDDIYQALKNANKSYYNQIDIMQNAAFNELNSAYQNALTNAKKSYDVDIAAAYLSSQNNATNIFGGNYGTGMQEYLQNKNLSALQEAYTSAMNNYSSNRDKLYSDLQTNQQTILSNMDKLRGEIDTELKGHAANAKSYVDSAYDYLSYLYNSDQYRYLFDRPEFSQYVTTDPTGLNRLFTRSELFSPEFGLLYEEDGKYYLTDKGKDFYRHMEKNTSPYSWGEFLSQSKDYEGVLDWAIGNDYGNKNFVYKDVLGIDSMDYTFKDTWSDKQSGVDIDETTFEDGFTFTDDNIVTDAYIDADDLKDTKWFVSSNDNVGENGVDVESFMNSEYVPEEVVESYKNLTLKSGTVFEGEDDATYVYMNDKIYALEDKTTHMQNMLVDDTDFKADGDKDVVDVTKDWESIQFGDFEGTGENGKQDALINQIVSDAINGLMKPGQIVNVNYGDGKPNYYEYVGNGKFVPIANGSKIKKTYGYEKYIYMPQGYETSFWLGHTVKE